MTGLFGVRRKLRVFIDGKCVGSIVLGEIAPYVVGPGEHRVSVKMDWTTAPPFEVLCPDGGTVNVDVVVPDGPSRASIRSVLSPGKVFQVQPRDPGLETPDLTSTAYKIGMVTGLAGVGCWVAALFGLGSTLRIALWFGGLLLVVLAVGISRRLPVVPGAQ
jgi:hypothetical protein